MPPPEDPKLLGISVEDVHGNAVPNADVVLRDRGSSVKTPLTSIRYSPAPGSSLQIFDLGNLPDLDVEVKAPQYFDYALRLTHTPQSGEFQLNARSVQWTMFAYPQGPGSRPWPHVRVIARRVRQAPRAMAASNPGSDVAPPIVDDPAGIWIDRRSGFRVPGAARARSAQRCVG